MAFTISIPDSADSISNLTIDNLLFEMRLTFNDRTESWYISLLNSDGLFLMKGLKVLPNVPLLRRNPALVPDGSNLYAVQVLQDDFANITRDNFGDGKVFELVHFKDDEKEGLFP